MIFSRFIIAFWAICFFSTQSLAQSAPLPWDAPRQGAFVMALSEDRQRRIWVGTEDFGLWAYDANAATQDRWKQYTMQSGLGDEHIYALAVDNKGRVWAGHSRGVSVFNGHEWKTYGTLDGTGGERIFDIAVCPVDGDVWLATNAGLTRYSAASERWVNFSRAEGLPAEDFSSLAFDHEGNIYAGTACDGLTIARRAGDYKTWRVISGPVRPTDAPFGNGLASNVINDVLVLENGTLYVATDNGLARSRDRGQTWDYGRGADWDDKVRDRFGDPPKNWKPTPGAALLEDQITCLAEDGAGLLWIGHATKGYEVFDTRLGKRLFAATGDSASNDYLRAILPLSRRPPLLAFYGGGLARAPKFYLPAGNGVREGMPAEIVEPLPPANSPPVVPLPKPAAPPDAATLRTMLETVPSTESPSIAPALFALPSDWLTHGDWIDRYGDLYAVLCAMGGKGNDYVTGYRSGSFERRGWLGRNHVGLDYLRYWVHWPQTDNPKALQNPVQGGRKQAEWDDHGETLQRTLDGPHVYGTLKVPKGRYLLSLYFHNKDGHESANRFRDYLIEVRPTPMEDEVFNNLGSKGISTEALFEKNASNGTRARVRDFWGGVYARFYVDATTNNYFTVRVNRNFSHNAILSAIFLDDVNRRPGFNKAELYVPAARRPRFTDAVPATAADSELAMRLLDRLLMAREHNPAWYALNQRKYLLPLLRWFLSREGGEPLAAVLEKTGKYPWLRRDMAACLGDLGLFAQRDRVYPDPFSYRLFGWSKLTELGRKANWDYARYRDWQWKQEEFQAFGRARQAGRSW